MDLIAKLQSETVQADICLGAAIVGIETLVGIGIIFFTTMTM
jgi:hypothetical protein